MEITYFASRDCARNTWIQPDSLVNPDTKLGLHNVVISDRSRIDQLIEKLQSFRTRFMKEKSIIYIVVLHSNINSVKQGFVQCLLNL